MTKMARVMFNSYPDLWHRSGGLQIQMIETARALRALGVTVTFEGDVTEPSAIAHVFGANSGVTRTARLSRSLVVSPVMHGPLGWRDQLADLNAIIHSRVPEGVARREVLQRSTAAISLSNAESEWIAKVRKTRSGSFQIPNSGSHIHRVHPESVVGIPSEPFGIVIGSVELRKGQLGVASAFADSGVPLVLAGPTRSSAYEQQCLDANSSLIRTGPLTSGQIAHLLTRAGVALILNSRSEGMPLVVYEALELGAKVFCTSHLTQVAGVPGVIAFERVEELPELVSKPLSHTAEPNLPTWEDVARDLVGVYEFVAANCR